MTWPDAVATIAIAACTCFIFYTLMKEDRE